MTTTIEELRLAALSPADLADAVGLMRRLDQERVPEDPVRPDEVFRPAWTTVWQAEAATLIREPA